MKKADTTAQPFEFGKPPRPKGLSVATRAAWNKEEAKLLAARKLAKSDTDLLLALLQARAEQYHGAGERRAAARKEVARLEKIWQARPAFPEPIAVNATPAPPTAPTLEAFIQSVRVARDSFTSRLVPNETVSPDSGGPFIWPVGHAATIAREYAQQVTQGGIVAGELVKLACQRFITDLEIGHTRGFYFDPEEAANIKAFFDHYVLEWKLQPWQTFIVVNLFAFKWASGLRRFRFGWLATGRKNGKSSFLAAIGTFCLCADTGTARPEVYSAACKKDQAAIIWGDAKQLVQSSPQLREGLILKAHGIETEEGGEFVALGADSNTLDGLRPSCSLIDEIHAHPSSAVTVRLQSGMLSRPQPIQLSATTAGEDQDGWCYAQHELQERFLRGAVEDHKFWDERFSYIAMCDAGDNPADEAVWIKANPNLGISCSLDGLRSQCREFQNDPQALFSFNRFHLNIWNSVIVGHSLPQDKINACVGCAMPAGGPMELRKKFLAAAQESRAIFLARLTLA